MASLVRHAICKPGSFWQKQPQVVSRFYATKAEKKKGLDRRPVPTIENTAQSLASRGFLRSQKDYSPPEDVEAKLSGVIERTIGNSDLTDPTRKFAVLAACFEEFQHGVPNSLLHTIETVDDLKQFYARPVSTRTPLEKLKHIALPPNLHVEQNYHRFDPETDAMFKGVTAFPKSSTLVTGLKYREKYKGHKQTQPWPDV